MVKSDTSSIVSSPDGVLPQDKIIWCETVARQGKAKGTTKSLKKSFYEDLIAEEIKNNALFKFPQHIRLKAKLLGIDLLNIEPGITTRFYLNGTPVSRKTKLKNELLDFDRNEGKD